MILTNRKGKNDKMKSLTIIMISLFIIAGCAGTNPKTTQKSNEKPDVFCTVEHPPHPLLMGTWECSFKQRNEEFPSYAKYTLIKYEDKYALHLYRAWKQGGRKKRTGWRDFIINGQQITGVPQQFGVRIFVEGEDVYFIMRDMDEPVRMRRVAD